MKELTIEHLAYLLKEAKENNKPQPIFFLGAGASRSGNIPLTQEIINDILKKHPSSPFINDLIEEERTYANLMDCLTPHERNELLKGYIDKAKINVTHIYLAQLLQEGYVDYILTVNFDNLMLRALAMFNVFPSTYDMAILKDLTTTTFKKKSVVYLHGQSHGLWLLNTPEEMNKVKTIIPRIFDSIKNERPWIFIGYSGEDPVFEHVKKLGRFDNSLYWITYKDESPKTQVENLITNPHTNAFLIKGYDSDSFMLKLNSELGLDQPSIVDKPFTALRDMLREIVDINEQEQFQGVKERVEIAKKQVTEAIKKYELGDLTTNNIDPIELEMDKLRKEIINLVINENFDIETIAHIEVRVLETKDNTLYTALSDLYASWGISLRKKAGNKEGKEGDKLYQEAFEKYEKAIKIKPNHHLAYNNWGIALGDMAEIKESDELYQKAFEKYERAVEIKPDYYTAYINWGVDLKNMAERKRNEEADELYQQAFEKYERAIEIKPDYYTAYNNWGMALGDMAESKENEEADELYQQAFEKYERAVEIKPDYYTAYSNWGADLGNKANIKEDEEADKLYQRAFTMYERALEIKPDIHTVYYYWGTDLVSMARGKESKEAGELYQQAFKKFKRAVEIKPDYYKAYANWGATIGQMAESKESEEADRLYQQAFEKYEKVVEITSDYHEVYSIWGANLGSMAHSKEGEEADKLYQQAFEKYKRAIEINPLNYEVYTNWGADLGNIAHSKEGEEADKLYQQAFEKYKRAIEIEPDYRKAYNYWIIDLENMAKKKSGEESERLNQQIIQLKERIIVEKKSKKLEEVLT